MQLKYSVLSFLLCVVIGFLFKKNIFHNYVKYLNKISHKRAQLDISFGEDIVDPLTFTFVVSSHFLPFGFVNLLMICIINLLIRTMCMRMLYSVSGIC